MPSVCGGAPSSPGKSGGSRPVAAWLLGDSWARPDDGREAPRTGQEAAGGGALCPEWLAQPGSLCSLPSTTAASAGRPCVASAAPGAPPSRAWASSLRCGCATAATRPSRRNSKSRRCRAAGRPGPGPLGALAPASRDSDVQVGRAFLSTRRLVFLCHRRQCTQWIHPCALAVPGCVRADRFWGGPFYRLIALRVAQDSLLSPSCFFTKS